MVTTLIQKFLARVSETEQMNERPMLACMNPADVEQLRGQIRHLGGEVEPDLPSGAAWSPQPQPTAFGALFGVPIWSDPGVKKGQIVMVRQVPDRAGVG